MMDSSGRSCSVLGCPRESQNFSQLSQRLSRDATRPAERADRRAASAASMSVPASARAAVGKVSKNDSEDSAVQSEREAVSQRAARGGNSRRP